MSRCRKLCPPLLLQLQILIKSEKRPKSPSLQPTPDEAEQLAFQVKDLASQTIGHKRKRSEICDYIIPQVHNEPVDNRMRIPPASFSLQKQDESNQTENKTERTTRYSIAHWIQQGEWPREFFEQDSMALGGRSSDSLVGPGCGMVTSCIEEDSQAAENPEYEQKLTAAGIYMDSEVLILDTSLFFCQELIDGNQEPPEGSLFQHNLFRETCSRYLHRNESMIFRDITPLIAPSAELLFSYGSANLGHLREELNTLWTKSIILAAGPRPKPDFAVGLKASAFDKVELEKILPYVGSWKDSCHVKMTDEMFFPFLTCEAKCGESGLDIADRQNAHSASIGANAIVLLYKAVSWEKGVSWEQEIDREVLTFSISNDEENVKIYAHYVVIDGEKISFHRHCLLEFSFTAQDGKEKWTAYNFTRNVYDKFLPIHLARVKKAVSQLQDPPPPANPDPPFRSWASPANELSGSLQMETSTGGFQNPRLPLTVVLQEEIDWQKQENFRLRQQIGRLVGLVEKQTELLGGQQPEIKGDLPAGGAQVE